MEQVILVNEYDEPIGMMEKMQAHETAVLHRAFSVFIFNNTGEMLLQQRAGTKYHSAGLWTNACCSHPRPGEETIAAAHRRLVEELGFDTELKKIFHFTYKADFSNGLVEHEFDHVFTGGYSGKIWPDVAEVSNYAYYTLQFIEDDLAQNPGKYTAWFHIAFPKIKDWWQLNVHNTNG
jgi:isopentenyl-diphosphate delta-isomerase